MKFLKEIITFSFVLLTLTAVNAQQRFSKEKFIQQRNQYLIQELNLTNEEAARFLPLCQELMEKKFALGLESRKKAHAIKVKGNVSDAEYESVIDTWINNRVKEALLEKEYYQKFKRVLPMQKLRKYQELDMKFMRQMMEKRDNRR